MGTMTVAVWPDERLEKIMLSLHRFARETNAPAGTDVVRWFERAHAEQVQREADRRAAAHLDPKSGRGVG